MRIAVGNGRAEVEPEQVARSAPDAGGGSGRARLTRRQLLSGAGGAAGLMALGGAAFGASRVFGSGGARTIGAYSPEPNGSVHVFDSRPDLRPPAVAASGRGVAPGYLFLGPKGAGGSQPGPLVVDARGDPVWFRPLASGQWASNAGVSQYRGDPVLAWWQGIVVAPGYGQGEGVIVDASYRELARVRAGNGRTADLHEFVLTPQGTALLTCTPAPVERDLSAIGGPRDAKVLDAILQEIDIHSGRVLFEWRSLDHVPVLESYSAPGSLYDYMHLNSIDLAPDGNLVVSARHTWAIYKLDRRTGEVIWRLGGKRSDFQMGAGAQFYWQHDARQLPDGSITVFDDGAGLQKTESQSRAVVLEVDERRKTARLSRAYRHPDPILADAMGNVQTLPDGHVLVGWGAEPYVGEFAGDGLLLSDVRLGSSRDSYRAFRYPWRAKPIERPALAAKRSVGTRNSTLYVSWNGATDVSQWQVNAGLSPTTLRPLGIAERHGFETAITIGRAEGYAAVTAVDVAGRRLGDSRPIQV